MTANLDKLILWCAERGKSWLYAVGMTMPEIYPEGTLWDKSQIILLANARGYDPADLIAGYEYGLELAKSRELIGC